MRRGPLLVRLPLLGVVIALPFVVPFGTLGTANLALVYAIVALSLVILTGWVGQISLAQAAFVGLGAYTTAVVVRAQIPILFPLTIGAGALVGAGAAALLGVVALRVRGLYLAVATLIFAWMAQGYLFNLPSVAGTGGSSIARTKPLGEPGQLPFLDFTERRTFYFILLAALAGALLAAANLRDSKTGRAWFAVKGSEVAAASLGIDVTRAKLIAFAVSGFIAGLAGGLVMTHSSVASASSFTVERSLFFLAVAVVGGLTSLAGALASGILFAGLEELFFRVEALGGLLLIVSASLLAGVLLFFPAGLAGIPPRIKTLISKLPRPRLRRRLSEAPTPEDDLVPASQEALPPADIAADGLVPDPSSPETPAGPTRLGSLLASIAKLTKAARSVAPWVLKNKPTASSKAGPGTPDVLLSALEAAAAAEEQVIRATLSTSTTLSYRPGIATKVELAPRDTLDPVLVAKDVTVRFGGLTAVNSFDLVVRQGEITGLIGPNGAGKTTLFNAISGLNQPTSGTVAIYGQDVTNLPVHQRAQVGVGRTFQVLQLFPELTVFENLMVATHIRNPTGFFSNLAATPRAVAWEATSRARVAQVVELTGLRQFAARRVSDLPFGTLRLVELARALVTGAPFIMLDEPASGLDNAETDRFMDFLLWVRQALGVTILLIEHDMRVAMGLADYLYVIDRGAKIAQGTPPEIQKNALVIAAYLGTPAEEEPAAGPAPSKNGSAKPKTKTPSRTKR